MRAAGSGPRAAGPAGPAASQRQGSAPEQAGPRQPPSSAPRTRPPALSHATAAAAAAAPASCNKTSLWQVRPDRQPPHGAGDDQPRRRRVCKVLEVGEWPRARPKAGYRRRCRYECIGMCVGDGRCAFTASAGCQPNHSASGAVPPRVKGGGGGMERPARLQEAHIGTHARTHMHTHAHANTQTHTRTRKLTHTHTQTHTHTHAHTHTRPRTHTHTHKFTLLETHKPLRSGPSLRACPTLRRT